MVMSPASIESLVHRILRRLSRFDDDAEANEFADLGRYDNSSVDSSAEISVGTLGIEVRRPSGRQRVEYSHIESVTSPPVAEGAKELTVRVRGLGEVVIAVEGAEGRFRDVFQF